MMRTLQRFMRVMRAAVDAMAQDAESARDEQQASPSDPFDLENKPIVTGVPVREVRLAVTMVGGTSLAIYENGVAQELYRVVRGHGMYGLLKRLTHSHAYVDVLSGTSAGAPCSACASRRSDRCSGSRAARSAAG